MLKNNYLIILFVIAGLQTYAQNSDSSGIWKWNASANSYFFSDHFIFVPVLKTDNGKLHLEGRYNYENINTGSAWAGYNFKGGNNFKYAFTPMFGVIAGNTNGLAPGLELNLIYKKFQVYTESEYLFVIAGKENSFFYNWLDFTYNLNKYFNFGLSAQRTQLYHNEMGIQRGFLLGACKNKWGLSAYLYNLGFTNNPFILISISCKN